MSQVGAGLGSTKMVYHAMVIFVANWKLFMLLHFILHMVPAYIADGTLSCMGRKTQCVDGYKKFLDAQKQIGYFTNRQWQFYNRNTRLLYQSLSPEDKKLFPFSMKGFDWPKYLKSYLSGARVYIIKDPLSTIPQALRKQKILFVIHNILKLGLCYTLYCGSRGIVNALGY